MRFVDAWTWYTPLSKQLQLEAREKLIRLAQPSAADLRNLSAGREKATKPRRRHNEHR